MLLVKKETKSKVKVFREIITLIKVLLFLALSFYIKF